MTLSVIVYGPHGCGKSVNAQRIADYLGLSVIVDDERRVFPAYDALYLTSDEPASGSHNAVAFDDIMREMATAVTTWFPPEVKPVRRGPYETFVHYYDMRTLREWDGEKWLARNGASHEAHTQHHRWRGLAVDPSEGV
jgi:hypothetical protein